MGFFRGPKPIIDSSLILHLDAANVKSFPGEPTINLISQPENFSTWSTSFTVRPDRVLAPDNTLTAYSMYSSSMDYPQMYSYINPPNTNLHRGSIWVKTNTGGNLTFNMNLFRNNPWGLGEQTDLTITPYWTRYDVSMTPLDTTQHVVWIGRHTYWCTSDGYINMESTSRK